LLFRGVGSIKGSEEVWLFDPDCGAFWRDEAQATRIQTTALMDYGSAGKRAKGKQTQQHIRHKVARWYSQLVHILDLIIHPGLPS
jgi:hypothetical protein